MALELSPLPASQHHLYPKLAEASFADGVMAVMYPQGVSPAASESMTAGMARIDARYPGRVRRFKVVDPSLPATDPYEGVVGISQWRIFPRDRSPEELAAEKKWTQADEAEYGHPEGLNVEMVETFGAKHGVLKEKHLGGRAHVYLHVLMTRPGFQRRGVGTLAMQWGVDQADALGLPAYIESSEQGAGLYKKFGFREIDVSPFDGGDWGHQNQMRHIIMWRDPKKVGSD